MMRHAIQCDECKRKLDNPVVLNSSEFILCAKCYDNLEKQTIIQSGIKREKA